MTEQMVRWMDGRMDRSWNKWCVKKKFLEAITCLYYKREQNKRRIQTSSYFFTWLLAMSVIMTHEITVETKCSLTKSWRHSQKKLRLKLVSFQQPGNQGRGHKVSSILNQRAFALLIPTIFYRHQCIAYMFLNIK